MWKYKQPDFALFLLGELQKQQQGSVFCDILLQTGGVCVPAHSCVLAALSPIFSRILSTSPAPPEGKNRLLSLEAVGSHALLKLVGFLYTGEMEIESRSEHEDVMSAAHKLGLKNLIEKKRVWVERGVEDVGRGWKEAAVQTDESMKAKESVSVPLHSERQRCTFYNANYCDPPGTSMLEADLSFDESSSSRGFNWISNVTVPPIADVTEVSNQCKTNAKNRWKMRDGQTQNPSWQQSQVKLLNVERAKLNQPEVMARSRNVSGKDFRKLLEAVSLPKIVTSEQKLDKFKVKIKLRRRGACWESNLIVSVQGESESDEAKECGPPTPTCPSSVLPAQSLVTLTPPTDLPISPSDCSSHVSSEKPCPHTPNRSSMPSALDLPALSSSPPQAHESDEQIAMLLEDMFMMGLNILPMMPLDKNLEEHELNQLDPLQEDKGAAKTSAQGSCPYVRGCEEEVRESCFTETVTPIRSPQKRYEELENSGFHNQLRPETVHPSAQLAGQELHASLSNMNKDTSLFTMEMDSVVPLVEDLLLTTKTTAGPDGPVSETGDMSDFNMSYIPEDRMDFRLRKCLSPLETDVLTNEPSEPSQEELSETHKQYPKAKKNPLLLSESSSKLDFPLGSVIDSSCSHPCLEPNGSQDQSTPEKQELKTHRDITTENGSSVDQANIIGELPKQRMTRKPLASQRLKESQESRAQTRLSKTKSDDNIKEPTCGNVQLKTPNSRGVSTQMFTPLNAYRKTVTGEKRKQENCLPCTKKMCLNTTSKQHEHEADLPKVQVTAGTVKQGRGRPPKSKKRAEKIKQKCDNAKKMRRAVLEKDAKKEANTREKDSTEMRKADVNGNFVQTKQNIHVKYSGQAKRSSIIDKMFHQTGNACRSSVGRQLTANPQDTTCSPPRLQGAVEKSGECGNLVNDSEYISESACGENKAVMSVVENKDEMDAVDNQVRLQMSHSSTSHTVHHTVEKGGRTAVEEIYVREATVHQSDFQNVMEISVIPLTSENFTKEVTNVDHAMSPTETSTSANNKPEVMESIDLTRIMQERHTSVCINPKAENLKNKKDAAVSNNQEFLENNEEGDLGICKVVQPIKETIENEETEIQMTNDKAVQEIAQCAYDVGNKKSDDSDLDGGQYSSDTLLEEDKLNTGHTAGGRMTDDSSNAAVTLRGTHVIVKNGPNVQTGEVSNQSTVTEDHSTLQIAVSSSDDEVIEVDVLQNTLFSNAPLLLLAAAQTITLPIEDLQDQDVEMDVTEEEEVDVTGEDTDKEDL